MHWWIVFQTSPISLSGIYLLIVLINVRRKIFACCNIHHLFWQASCTLLHEWRWKVHGLLMCYSGLYSQVAQWGSCYLFCFCGRNRSHKCRPSKSQNLDLSENTCKSWKKASGFHFWGLWYKLVILINFKKKWFLILVCASKLIWISKCFACSARGRGRRRHHDPWTC